MCALLLAISFHSITSPLFFKGLASLSLPHAILCYFFSPLNDLKSKEPAADAVHVPTDMRCVSGAWRPVLDTDLCIGYGTAFPLSGECGVLFPVACQRGRRCTDGSRDRRAPHQTRFGVVPLFTFPSIVRRACSRWMRGDIPIP